MNLFNRLLKLKTDDICRLEDFFTEIVAHFFEVNQNALKSWLKFSDVIESTNWANASLATQKSYQHPYKNQEKRPDIIVELSDGNATSIIFFESKIASNEGLDQLRDYAIVLDALTGYQQKHLIYITRDFDPKVFEEVLQDIPDDEVGFIQLRWHQFYQFLSTQPESALIHEIQLFMEEHGMAQKHQFSPHDLAALFHLPETLAVMDATLWDKALDKFNIVLDDQKSKIIRKRKAWEQISFRHRYFVGTRMQDGWGCWMGFQFKAFRPSAQQPFNPKDYPNICLVLQVDPDSPKRSEIVDGMRSISDEFGWQKHQLDQPDAWSGIFLSKSLREFLISEDQVSAVEEYFVTSLEQLKIIKEKYSDLPWRVT